jgi:cytochrome c oxidase subunit 3
MMAEITGPRRTEKRKFAMDPLEFMMWAFMVSVFMIFAGFTSGYIVRKGDGNWLQFALPSAFMLSTALVALSSIALQWSFAQAKKNELAKVKIGMSITLLLGLGFVGAQLLAYSQLVNIGLFLNGNPSVGFLYVVTFIHALHVLSAIIALIVIFAQAFRFQVHSKKLLGMKLVTLFWHFLGILWIYLYGFFYFMN